MTLGDLIDEIRKHDPAKRVPDGFARPHSYRGSYECLAFEPAKDVTVGAMLEAAVAADGATYQGYKGGHFRMDKYTQVYLAEYGDQGEPLGLLTLRAMLNPVEDAVRAAVAAERAWAADICKRVGDEYMAESAVCQKFAPYTRAGEVPAQQAGAAWKCEAAIRRGPDQQPGDGGAVVSDSDRGPATADGQPWKGV